MVSRRSSLSHSVSTTACHAGRSDGINVCDIVQSPGPTLRLREWGTGPPCLLIHGFGDGSFVWDEFATKLGPYRVLAVDLRGHGDSHWAANQEYQVNAHLADLLNVIRQLTLDNLVVAGHSFGGELALRLAAQLPVLIKALVLIDFGPRSTVAGAGRVVADFRAAHQVYACPEAYVAWLHQRRPLAQLETLRRTAAAVLYRSSSGRYELKSDVAMADWMELQIGNPIKEAALWRMLKRIACPTLVMRGEASAVLSREVARDMVMALSAGELQTIPYAGHAVMSDNPEDFLTTLRSFLHHLPAVPPTTTDHSASQTQ